MAILEILKYPDPRLKLVAQPIEAFDEQLQQLAGDMLETMYQFDGIGLAAVQVNVPSRMCVVDISDSKDQSLCLINPQIISQSGESVQDEGCLSFPGIYAKVKRYTDIALHYYDLQGKLQELQARGWLAICIQHEIDHLDGITFFDRLSTLKQKLLRKKIRDNIS